MECDKTADHRQAWVRERYQEVQTILNEHEAKQDPNVLYEKKSRAVEILEEILEVLTKEICSTAMIAITHLNIGILQADMQDMELAKEHFTRCIKMLEESKLTPEGILPAISANNQMGIFYAQKGLYEKARDFLETAEILYFKFTEDTACDPISMVSIMGIEEIEGDPCPKSCLEKLHTLTLYYLAQVSRQLEDKCNFALYCHRTLSKQLSQNKITRDLDYVEWALNAATISQYFVEHENFPQARHHLAAASCILREYHAILEAKGTKETSESIAAEYETYDHRSADVARCWAKYGIALLSASKERLCEEVEREDGAEPAAEVTGDSHKCRQTREATESLRFVDLEPQLEVFTSEITDKYLLDFADAKPVFLNVRKWLDKATAYYTFESHASDYACIAQDVSRAYKYLAFYEMNEDRQAKMHKRRIDTLEAVIQGLSPRFYRNVCREIWLELADVYSEILDIKIDRIQASDEKPTAQMTAKIERLARSSIKHYQSYLSSLETSKSDDGVVSFPDEQLEMALRSYFHIGRLHNKIITSDVEKRIENMLKSVEAHGVVVDYYDRHPEKQEELKRCEFIELSREFVKLLPLTINRLRQQQPS